MTRADAFYELGRLEKLSGINGRCEFAFAWHADFENYLSGRAAARIEGRA